MGHVIDKFQAALPVPPLRAALVNVWIVPAAATGATGTVKSLPGPNNKPNATLTSRSIMHTF